MPRHDKKRPPAMKERDELCPLHECWRLVKRP
uniref:Uncharacterized protein n=1 Tax=Virus sp. ctAgr11 TaxID=2825800 RepID=A0A8S5RJ82_9VIRU|nr:MAG TPA: hypothetical protein [Virus sp. ctAgr11]